MVSEARARRIGDRIQEELSVLFQREVSDPRLVMLTVTDVEVDRELAFATVFVTATGGEERMEEVLQALDGAGGFLRHELASRINLRNFPRLRFRWDFSQERGARIDELLDMLSSEDEGDTSEIRDH
ncbi:MAG: 30S ribosome-binding factor RbfA [Anaerolineaceae bacterium]|nr:MAG: 30S ribosome-binding factor RbfA [Anaerolineaceae bacterium]